ncbi:conserved hypothetical protein [Desulfarculales bacterium]
MNYEVFKKGMLVLTALYPDYALKEGTMDGYWEFLQHLGPREFELAVKSHISKHKWFPKVSELLEAGQPLEPDPQEIWAGLIAWAEADIKPELDFATQRALDTVCGGWGKFKVTPYDELKFLFKNFKEAHLHARAVQKRGQELLGGAPLPQIGGE